LTLGATDNGLALDAEREDPLPRRTVGARAQMETAVPFDRKGLQDNDARLAQLYRRQEPDLLIVCGRGPTLYGCAAASASA